MDQTDAQMGQQSLKHYIASGSHLENRGVGSRKTVGKVGFNDLWYLTGSRTGGPKTAGPGTGRPGTGRPVSGEPGDWQARDWQVRDWRARG